MIGEARMFNHNSFSPISFSRTAWAGIKQQQQQGRSGYWRLFYHQLQEAALNEKGVEPVKLKAVKYEPYVEQPDGSVIFGKPAKLKAKQAASTDEPAKNYIAETMRWHCQVKLLLAELTSFSKVGALRSSDYGEHKEDEDALLISLVV